MKTNLSYQRNLIQYSREKSQHRTLWSLWKPSRYQDCLSDITGVKFIGLNSSSSSSEIHRGISIIQHFHRGELNCLIYICEVENVNFFLWRVVLLVRELYQKFFQGAFSRGTETGCHIHTYKQSKWESKFAIWSDITDANNIINN